MRPLTMILIGLLALIQYPLWIGKGGWLRVWELDRQIAHQKSINERLAGRNAALDGEVADLRRGVLAIEERARYDLGMVRKDEIFVHFGRDAAR